MPQKKIALLASDVINKIAAGEIIENCASIVKELIDNALDAGATNIQILTSGAGRELIEVSDNGCGIVAQDLSMAFLRHATSKISAVDDLYTLSTMGFRGEALASISAVSKVTLHSAVEGAVGVKVEAEGEKIVEESTLPRQKGTTVSVRELFFNFPVRQKFQKNASYEIQEINKALVSLILPFTEVAFQWSSEGKEMFHLTTPRDLITSIEMLLGKNFAKELFPITVNKADFSLTGYLSNPQSVKSNKMGQYVFVNRRFITSPLLAEAVKEGYGTRICHDKFPSFVLFFDLPKELIDVNIHPQKKNVRFQKEKEVASFIKEAVARALEKRAVPAFVTEKNFIESELKSFSFSPAPLLFSTHSPLCEQEESLFQLVAVIDSFFLIKNKEFFLLDAQRARSRIFFEKMEKQTIEVELLLIPYIIEVTPLKRRAIDEQAALFEKLKISLRPFDESSYIIESLPVGFCEKKVSLFIDHLLEGKGKKEDFFSQPFKLSKISAFSFSDAEALLRELMKCTNPYQCPENRPLMIPWPKEEIQKLFK